MKKNAFTLVELLAVIVILAIVLIIAVPGVLSIINKTKEDAYKSQLLLIRDAGKMYVAANLPNMDFRTDTNGTHAVINLSDLQAQGYLDKKLYDPRDKSLMNGLSVVVERSEQDKMTYTVVETDSSNATYPVFNNNMIPIRYDGTNWVKANVTNKNQSWFDYSKQNWANIATVTSDVRSSLINAKTGTIVPMDKILAMYVWIPRYRYQLWNVDGTVSTTNNPYLKNMQVSIEFEGTSVKKSNGTKNGEWLTHPAFTFGGKELSGFWASKFEVSSVEGNGNTTELDDVLTKTPQFKPGQFSWRNQSLSTTFRNSQKMTQPGNIYGFTKEQDSHVFKNREWGAMAYLTLSDYGMQGNPLYTGSEKTILANGSRNYTTGCGSLTQVNTCSDLYDTKLGQRASTTGNVTGIYDTSGGSWDQLMAMHYNPDNVTLNQFFSGFTNEELELIKDKYVDAYLYQPDPVEMIGY